MTSAAAAFTLQLYWFEGDRTATTITITVCVSLLTVILCENLRGHY
jgi:hypothetical protein